MGTPNVIKLSNCGGVTHFLACENDKICSKSAIAGLFRAAMEVRRTFNLRPRDGPASPLLRNDAC